MAGKTITSINTQTRKSYTPPEQTYFEILAMRMSNHYAMTGIYCFQITGRELQAEELKAIFINWIQGTDLFFEIMEKYKPKIDEITDEEINNIIKEVELKSEEKHRILLEWVKVGLKLFK